MHTHDSPWTCGLLERVVCPPPPDPPCDPSGPFHPLDLGLPTCEIEIVKVPPGSGGVPHQEVEPPPLPPPVALTLLSFAEHLNICYVQHQPRDQLRDLYSLGLVAAPGERSPFPVPDLETELSWELAVQGQSCLLGAGRPVRSQPSLCLPSSAGVLLAVGVAVFCSGVRFASRPLWVAHGSWLFFPLSVWAG